MTEPIDPAVEVIAEDKPCIHCGYNLRGLMPDGRCPECGEEIGQSLRGNLLKYADPEWLDRLYFGANLKLWNIALGIVVGIAGGILVAIGLPLTILVLGGLAGGALGLWASFVITTQEPRISLQEDSITLRKIIRSCAVAAFVGSMFQQADTVGNIGTVAYVLGVLLSLAGLVVSFGELLYLRRFALRIPDEKLAKSTKTLMWAIPIIGACGMIVAFLSALFAGTGAAPAPLTTTTTTPTSTPPSVTPSAGMAVFGFVVCFGGLLALVLFLWYVRMLYAYKHAFKEAAAESRGLAAKGEAQVPEPTQPEE
ncbi:MAG: hypothetical protein JSU63_13570 [Phycisphaerales bacterium]|nr:MAG: hypothetical protein JSU63_13570 [Phycisphaerales bacterium]